jgi:hypothetical protein
VAASGKPTTKAAGTKLHELLLKLVFLPLKAFVTFIIKKNKTITNIAKIQKNKLSFSFSKRLK